MNLIKNVFMDRKYPAFYIASLLVIFAASAYPVYMGCVTLSAYLRQGFVMAEDYPKYVIPYAPLSIAVITIAVLMPVFYKRFRRFPLMIASVAGAAIFFLCEYGFEQMRVVEGYRQLPLESWQYSLCVATPEVLKSIGEPIYAENNPAFKIHFYLIALVILLAVTHILHGFTRMIKEEEYHRKKLLIVQLAATVLFILLCILACLTAFYRSGTIVVSPLSAFLMGLFFIVFGIVPGISLCCLFWGKRRLFSVLAPSALSVAATLAMYAGELVLTDGVLFRFGHGSFFTPIGGLPFAAVDLLVIFLSGAVTYILSSAINAGSGFPGPSAVHQESGERKEG
ncbi:MAG TPA: hypothetical protein VN381_09550 [Anaerovoracaceae bacterium]|nr:hypothetical protein [Anaerovoracaceae bacterium]